MSDGSAASILFIVYGSFGLTGLATSWARDRIGLVWLLRLLLLAAAVSLALAALLPGSWPGLVLSAGLQGINVMMLSAVLAFWSERIFPAFPSLSFTTALLATAAGSVVAPILAGLVSDAFSPAGMFLGASVLPFAAAIILRADYVHERPLPSPVSAHQS